MQKGLHDPMLSNLLFEVIFGNRERGKIGGISNFVNLIFKFKSPMFPEAVDCTDNRAMKT